MPLDDLGDLRTTFIDFEVIASPAGDVNGDHAGDLVLSSPSDGMYVLYGRQIESIFEDSFED